MTQMNNNNSLQDLSDEFLRTLLKDSRARNEELTTELHKELRELSDKYATEYLTNKILGTKSSNFEFKGKHYIPIKTRDDRYLVGNFDLLIDGSNYNPLQKYYVP